MIAELIRGLARYEKLEHEVVMTEEKLTTHLFGERRYADDAERGIGRVLLERLAQVAIDRGCGRLEWAVLDWNQDAIRFYERLGAKPNSEWTVYRLTGEPLRALAGE